MDFGNRPGVERGQLRAAVLRAGRDLIAESGVTALSVAEVARRLGVSTAAPYRHFADRDDVLAAVATGAARELAEVMDAAASAAGEEPLDAAAAAIGAYVRHVAARRIGFPFLFGAAAASLADDGLRDATRHVMDVVVAIVTATGSRAAMSTIRLADEILAVSHGVVEAHLASALAPDLGVDAAAARAGELARVLLSPTPRSPRRVRSTSRREAISPADTDITAQPSLF